MFLPLAIFNINFMSSNLLLLVSVLVFISLLVNKVGARFGVPTLLLFLLVGMLAGRDGLGIHLENHEVAESIGHFAMTIILLTGGLETSLKETRPVMKQGLLLSTVGVMLTILLTGVFTYWVARPHLGAIGASLLGCLLVATVMSSTDSATVFNILRDRRQRLREDLGPMLELESGSNDPMAYVLTIILVEVLSAAQALPPGSSAWPLVGKGFLILILQLIVGFAIGIGVGFAAKWLLGKVHLQGGPLYAIMILSLGFFANGIANVLHGNGLLALYTAAILIGNYAELPYKRDILKFFDGLTWLVKLLMFLVLGLMARPSQFPSAIIPALLIGLFMIFIARPASVFLTLLPFRKMSFRAKFFTSWVGIKGAGPILFALYPVVFGLEDSDTMFNIVFFITLLSLLIQGMTLSPMARALGLVDQEDPEVETFGMDIPEEMGMLRDHIVTEDDLADGDTLRDLHLPHGIRVMMVRRKDKFIVPHGSLKLSAGDRLVILIGDTED